MFINIKKWLNKHWYWLILLIVSICFFIGAAGFNYYTQSGDFIKWLSPDESANYSFTKLYAQERRLAIFEKYDLLAGDIIHPRSYLSEQGTMKPVSFLGLILIYGKIAGLTSYKIIPYLTPFFAAIGIFFYYLLIKKIFGKRNAFISALILACFPPFIYYSSRSMFHNVLFLILLIISLYFAAIMGRGEKTSDSPGSSEKPNFFSNTISFLLEYSLYAPYLSAALAGSFLGLAIITRPVELIWLIPIWLVLWLLNMRKIGFIKLMIFLAFLSFSLLPALYWNKILYQSYWRGGYGEMNQSIINMASAGQAIVMSSGLKTAIIKENLSQIKNNFFHFGFWPVKSFKMLYYYFAKMFFWLFWPALLGSLWFLFNIREWKHRQISYLAAYTICFFILLFYYGSWDFHDNPDPKSHTIGNSYARYWLPIYLGAMPLASFFILKLADLFRKKIFIRVFQALIFAFIFLISIKFVLTGSAEGLIQSAKKQEASRLEYNKVLGLTEARAVIITQYHDKLFFPERKVIVGLFNDDNMIKQYANLTKYLPVYYYNFTFPEKDYNYLNDRKLAAFNLRINPVEKVTDSFTLYRLEKANTDARIVNPKP